MLGPPESTPVGRRPDEPATAGGDVGSLAHSEANRASLAALPKAPTLVDHAVINRQEAARERLARQRQRLDDRGGVGQRANRT